MTKYLITWNAGCGENWEVVEAKSDAEAQSMAYESWREEAESNSDYDARVLTQDLAEDYGVEDDEEEYMDEEDRLAEERGEQISDERRAEGTDYNPFTEEN